MSVKFAPLTKDQDKVFDTLTSTSGQIRYLTSINYTRGQIVALINDKRGPDAKQLRYQHVRNVQLTPVTTPKDQF